MPAEDSLASPRRPPPHQAPTPATTAQHPPAPRPAPPPLRGTFDPARPHDPSPPDGLVDAPSQLEERLKDVQLGRGHNPPHEPDGRPALHLDLPPSHQAAAHARGVTPNKSALQAAEFLATRVFDVPSFSALPPVDESGQVSGGGGGGGGGGGVHEGKDESDPALASSVGAAAAAAAQAASSAVLAALAPRCEPADVDQLAAGWNGAVLIGPVPSVNAGLGTGGSLGSYSTSASLGSPLLASSRANAPTTPLGMPARHHSAGAERGYLDEPRSAGNGDEEEDEDGANTADHRTLYVTLPAPAPSPTPPKSPVQSLQASPTNEKSASITSPIQSQSQSQRPGPTRRPSRTAATSSAVSATLRHAVLNILDHASETLACLTVVFVLERSRPDLADLLHGLCYVGGQVLHVKGTPSRRGPLGRGMGASPSSRSGGPGGGAGVSWDQRTPRASPATPGGGVGSGGGHRGSYGSIGSITAPFPGSVVMPVRIAGPQQQQQQQQHGKALGGSGSGRPGETAASTDGVLGDDDMLLLPRSDVILVAVAL